MKAIDKYIFYYEELRKEVFEEKEKYLNDDFLVSEFQYAVKQQKYDDICLFLAQLIELKDEGCN